MHWAAALIGKPWQPMAEGPNAFYCWGLVRHAVELRHGVALPVVRTDGALNVAAITRVAEARGWHKADGPAQVDDVVFVREPGGRRHAGYVIEIRGRLEVLHANGRCDAAGRATGCVERERLEDFLAGYTEPEFWRRAA